MAKSLQSLHWHAEPPDAVCAVLQVNPARGLSDTEAQTRLATYGPNRLAERAPTVAAAPPMKVFLLIFITCSLFSLEVAKPARRRS